MTLVSHVAADPAALRAAVAELARTIAAKSPIALRGTKEMLAYAESHSPDECFKYVRTLNGAALQTNDVPPLQHTPCKVKVSRPQLTAAMEAFFGKKQPVYSKL